MNNKLLSLAAGSALMLGLITTTDTVQATNRSARTTLTTATGRKIGTVKFIVIGGHTEVRVSLNTGGLTEVEVDVFHGFHIHANDGTTNGDGCIADPAAAPATWFVSADGHYNPTKATHSHHVGDMPMVYFNSDGSVETRFRLDQIDPGDVIGKVVILHAGLDNYGNIPLGDLPTQYKANSTEATDATAKTGNAGNRIACGVITF